MNLTSKVKQLDAAYFSRALLQNPLFLAVTAMALLTVIRAFWILIGFWGALSFDLKMLAVSLLIVLPAPFVLAVRLKERIGEKLLALGDQNLTADMGRFFIMAPFFAYFSIYLALELVFLTLRHR